MSCPRSAEILAAVDLGYLSQGCDPALSTDQTPDDGSGTCTHIKFDALDGLLLLVAEASSPGLANTPNRGSSLPDPDSIEFWTVLGTLAFRAAVPLAPFILQIWKAWP